MRFRLVIYYIMYFQNVNDSEYVYGKNMQIFTSNVKVYAVIFVLKIGFKFKNSNPIKIFILPMFLPYLRQF